MDLQNQLDTLMARVTQNEIDIAIIQTQVKNHDVQLDAIVSTLAQLTAIKDELHTLSTKITIDNDKHNHRINTIVACGMGAVATIAFTITNWTTIKSFFGG